jgi:uncharacterized protein YwqG
MHGDGQDGGELGALIAALRIKTQEMAAIDHVGHYNRLFRQRVKIYQAIEACPEGVEGLRQLFDDADRKIQLDVARHCKYQKLNLEAALATFRRLAEHPDKIGKEAKHSLDFRLPERDPNAPPIVPRKFPFVSPPPGCDRREAEGMVRAAFGPERSKSIIALLRPAIRIWPKKLALSPSASRYGGLPAVPPDWSWPFAHEEPLLFLAQINCAELGPLAQAFNLPNHGVLSFFGDHDVVTGCEPEGASCVFYFPKIEDLAPALLPLDDFEPLITCGMHYYETFELPHPMSNAVEALDLSETEHDSYYELSEDVSAFGFAESDSVHETEISKLFGWPDLIQDDVEDPNGGPTRLLLQLGAFRDGTEHAGWGPGGLVYFMIRPEDLDAQAFDRAELQMQCT